MLPLQSISPQLNRPCAPTRRIQYIYEGESRDHSSIQFMKSKLSNQNKYRVYSCNEDAQISRRYLNDRFDKNQESGLSEQKAKGWKVRAEQKGRGMRSLDISKKTQNQTMSLTAEKQLRINLQKKAKTRTSTDNSGYTNPDMYMQQLQQQKNRRIQQIYNPHTCLPPSLPAAPIQSEVNIPGRSIGVLRNKNKNKLLRHTNLDESSENVQRSLKKLVSNKKVQRNNTKIMSSHTIQVPTHKIMPVTFQRPSHLSPITESNPKLKPKIKPYSSSRPKITLTNQRQKLRPQQIKVAISDSQLRLNQKSPQSRVPSEGGGVYPRYSSFFEGFQKEDNSWENKTFLFYKNRRNIEEYQDKESGQKSYKCQQQCISNNLMNRVLAQPGLDSQVKKERLKQLAIFEHLDKSMLKIIRAKDCVFYGQVDSKGQRHGKGALFYDDGKIYEGEFQNNKKHGMGTQLFMDGSVYSGSFVENKRNGKGRFEWPNGQTYDGQWLNNLKHGSGLWQSKDTFASYLGEWSYGSISGFGVLTNDKGQRYEGQFVNFNKQGHGAYRFANGDRLVGSFKKNQPNGECQYFWQNGDYYKGTFSNGLRHGLGFIKYSDKSIFEGQFRNDKKCGLGKQVYNDSLTYYGNYENDLRHGFGKLTYGDQLYYEGYWLNNVAVIFQQNKKHIEEIPQDQKQVMISRLGKKISNEKFKRLKSEQQNKIIKSMRNQAVIKKDKIQKFSSKNLLERLCNPKKRKCRCSLQH